MISALTRDLLSHHSIVIHISRNLTFLWEDMWPSVYSGINIHVDISLICYTVYGTVYIMIIKSRNNNKSENTATGDNSSLPVNCTYSKLEPITATVDIRVSFWFNSTGGLLSCIFVKIPTTKIFTERS